MAPEPLRLAISRPVSDPVPPCPRCHLSDRVEEEEQTGSVMRWFVCERCGRRFNAPPIAPVKN